MRASTPARCCSSVRSPIGARETGGSLHDRLAALGAEAIVAAIDGWQAGRLAPVAQPAEGVTYAAKIRKEEARIDWTQPAEAIDRQVRAFNPWPVAETRWQGQQLRDLGGRAHQATRPRREPGAGPRGGSGRLRRRHGRGRCCGSTACSWPAGAPRRAAEFLNAHALAGRAARVMTATPSPAQIRAAAASLVAQTLRATAARWTTCWPATRTRARRAA